MMRSLVLALFVVLPQPALAGKPIVVGNGTAASCNETALKEALLVVETIGGGTIRFKCGPAPVTIALSQVIDVADMLVLLVLPNNTTIDGGGLVALDGTGTATVVFVEEGTTAALRGLTIANGGTFASDGRASGIVNFGALTVSNSIVSGNLSLLAGGIFNSGALKINDSVVSNNHGFFLGGVVNLGTLTVHNTTFAANSGAFDGGAILNVGTVTIHDSAFSHNRTPDGTGGAILNVGTLTINHTTFSENQADAPFTGGGAIENFGTVEVNDSTFSQNSATLAGGAIYNTGTLIINNSTLSDNGSSSFGGGGAVANFGTLNVSNSTFSDNAGGRGGGIFNAATLTVKGSIITHNTAFSGGGIYICVEGQFPPFPSPVPCHGTLSLKETTVTENTPDDIFP